MVLCFLIQASGFRLFQLSLPRLARVTSGKEKIKKKHKWEIRKQCEVSCKSFLYYVMTHLRNTVVFNAYLYVQLETGAVFSH